MQRNPHRDDRVRSVIFEAAATYVGRESTNQSLITLTRIEPSKDGRRMTLFISVLPTTHENAAISFLNRHRHDLFEYIKKTTSLDFIPKIEFLIDDGEKNRQRIDTLVHEDEQLASDD